MFALRVPPVLFKISSIFLILILLTSPALPASAQSGSISGSVTRPGALPLPDGTIVRLYDPGSDNVRGTATPDPISGAFSMAGIPNGLYVIRALAPAGSGLAPSFPRPVSIFDAPVNVGVLSLTNPQLNGSVYAPASTTLTNAIVFVYLPDGRVVERAPAPGGHFVVGGLPAGSYYLVAYPDSDNPYWRSLREPVTISPDGLLQAVSLTLTPAQLYGNASVMIGLQSRPVAGATITAASADGKRQKTLSRLSGYWAIGGLQPGSYRLTALPAWPDSGLLPPAPITVSVPYAGNPIPIQFQVADKKLSGTVQTNTSQPVSHALVLARKVNAPGHAETETGVDGAYQLALGPGLWAVTVRPITDTVPSAWVYLLPPQLIYFRYNNEPESQTQDFTVLTADAQVKGSVELPGGATPTFTVTVALHNGEGVGLSTRIQPNGTFSMNVPNGVYKVTVNPKSEEYVGPVVAPISVPPEGTYDLGVLTLLKRDALITGTVSSTAGAGVEGVRISAWRQGAPGSLQTATGPDGKYALAVSAGDWHIQPAPGPDMPYLYVGKGENVTLSSGEVKADVDFSLTYADATINGTLVDPLGNPVAGMDGWAKAINTITPTLRSGAPIQDSAFSIRVPAGTYKVSAALPPASPYMSGVEKQVTVEAGGSVDITITVRKENSTIAGALWDPRAGQVVAGVAGVVTAWDPTNWAATPIHTGNGAYKLDVAVGLWRLNYRIDPTAGYAKLGEPVNVPAQAGRVSAVPLPVTKIDASISGQVQKPDGSPLPGAVVIARGKGAMVDNLVFYAKSDINGNYKVKLPYGIYRLNATLPGSDWLKPVEREVVVKPNTDLTGQNLRFRQPDATLSGTLTVSNTTAGGDVLVWAWSDDGAITKGHFPVIASGNQASGPYSLSVTSGTTWHLGAVMETSDQYWSGRAEVTVSGSSATQDITLDGPHAKPAPVVVTFDSSQPQEIDLADGTHIYIPANALPASGMITLRVVPLAQLPHQPHANVLRYGYAFLATDENGQAVESHFNEDVVISFGYNKAELNAQHIHEQWLKPAYFSTTTDQWTFPESYVVDTENNQVVMQIDHFTDFALLGEPTWTAYLPTIMP